jgi:hypothetical protein
MWREKPFARHLKWRDTVISAIKIVNMPKVVSTVELDRIAEFIARHPEGLGIEGLFHALGGHTPRRTLQRRLSALGKQGRIVAQGEGRAIKYRSAAVTGTAGVPLSALQGEGTGEVYVPLSTESKMIKAMIRQPMHQRRPVGYAIGFLETYQPNVTAYLPDSLRDQLHALGRSPAEHAAAGTFARDIMNRLLIDLSWASSQLEGNTYTRLDTQRLIEFGEAAAGKDALETQMILNHKAAIEYLVHGMDGGDIGINTETILGLHAFLSDGLLQYPQSVGRIRTRAVEVGGSVYRPIALPQKLEELFGIVIDMAAEIDDPFEQAFFLMVHLPYLQPFLDVNKRVSRLAANIPLIRHNLCPLSFIDVPQQAYVDGMIAVYELNRIELLRDVFIWAYERSCQQYVAVRQQLVPPDTFRLRYRTELSDAVRAIIRRAQPVSEEAIRSVMPPTVLGADRDRFVALVLEEFNALHAGNAIRFGLRPLEFETWRKKYQV